ncbi:hypothetical protein TREES_T100009683 [Tupaia chinensis]|uniref:Uncharacterized protein n=1 Tax=Tupaia chinensis TaxID=246437 RepID=L9L2Z3_TUPCH|nr:hypothetical protein TREES_T100009683 [Tupaia chinensis]
MRRRVLSRGRLRCQSEMGVGGPGAGLKGSCDEGVPESWGSITVCQRARLLGAGHRGSPLESRARASPAGLSVPAAASMAPKRGWEAWRAGFQQELQGASLASAQA